MATSQNNRKASQSRTRSPRSSKIVKDEISLTTLFESIERLKSNLRPSWMSGGYPDSNDLLHGLVIAPEIFDQLGSYLRSQHRSRSATSARSSSSVSSANGLRRTRPRTSKPRSSK